MNFNGIVLVVVVKIWGLGFKKVMVCLYGVEVFKVEIEC